jgi:hypothetical protein
VPDLVVRQKRLLGVDELVLDDRGPFAGKCELRVRHGRQELQEIRAAQDTGNAGRARRARQIRGANACMGERAADEDRVQHVRQIEIGDELSAAGEQAMILAARQRAADERGSVGRVHLRKTVPIVPGHSAGIFTQTAQA